MRDARQFSSLVWGLSVFHQGQLRCSKLCYFEGVGLIWLFDR